MPQDCVGHMIEMTRIIVTSLREVIECNMETIR